MSLTQELTFGHSGITLYYEFLKVLMKHYPSSYSRKEQSLLKSSSGFLLQFLALQIETANMLPHSCFRVYHQRVCKSNSEIQDKYPFHNRLDLCTHKSPYCWKTAYVSQIRSSAKGDPSHQHDCTVMFSLHPNESQINGCDIPVSILVSLALELLLIYTVLSDTTVIGLATINISLVKPSACSDWSGNPMACVLKIHSLK